MLCVRCRFALLWRICGLPWGVLRQVALLAHSLAWCAETVANRQIDRAMAVVVRDGNFEEAAQAEVEIERDEKIRRDIEMEREGPVEDHWTTGRKTTIITKFSPRLRLVHVRSVASSGSNDKKTGADISFLFFSLF